MRGRVRLGFGKAAVLPDCSGSTAAGLPHRYRKTKKEGVLLLVMRDAAISIFRFQAVAGRHQLQIQSPSPFV